MEGNGSLHIPEPVPEKLEAFHVVVYREFVASRREALKRHGLDHVPDESPQYGLIGKRIKAIRDAARVKDDDERAFDVLFAMFARFFAADWPAKYDTPYGFLVFASPKTFTQFLEGEAAA